MVDAAVRQEGEIVSLFTNAADRHLPILTQFYQLDPCDPNELAEGMRRLALEGVTFAKAAGLLKGLSLTRPQNFRFTRPDYQERVRQLHTLVRRVMDDVADTGRMKEADYIELHKESLLDLAASMYGLKNVPLDAEQTFAAGAAQEGLVLANMAYTLLFLITRQAMLLFAGESYPSRVHPLLSDLYNRVARCAACHSVYVLFPRRTRPFCSKRCAERIRMQEKRRQEVITGGEKRRGRPRGQNSGNS
jgi:hypothetical protein